MIELMESSIARLDKRRIFQILGGLKKWQYPFLVLYVTALAYSAFYAIASVMDFRGPELQAWETLCMGKEITGRKCIVAVGWSVMHGHYIIAIGHTAVGVVAIGVISIGIITIGQFGLGVLFTAAITGLNLGVVYGLFVGGLMSPMCMIGFTIFQTHYSKGLLNLAFYQLNPQQLLKDFNKDYEDDYVPPHVKHESRDLESSDWAKDEKLGRRRMSADAA